jgi:AbiV family abortive infection protein
MKRWLRFRLVRSVVYSTLTIRAPPVVQENVILRGISSDKRQRQVANSHSELGNKKAATNAREQLAKGMLEIPRNKIDDGLKRIARNIRSFSKDVDLLLKSRSDWHAIALAIFALEELGKYNALQEAKRTATGTASVKINKKLFVNHAYKQAIAKGLLPDKTWTLLPRVVLLDPEDSSKHVLSHSVKVSPQLRLDCLFVDWKDGNWNFGFPESREHVRDFVHAIEDALWVLETVDRRLKQQT